MNASPIEIADEVVTFTLAEQVKTLPKFKQVANVNQARKNASPL